MEALCRMSIKIQYLNTCTRSGAMDQCETILGDTTTAFLCEVHYTTFIKGHVSARSVWQRPGSILNG